MLSGFWNSHYDRELRTWTQHMFDLPNNSAGGKKNRRMRECLWCNF
jgi:hypothetical protein